MSTEERFSIRRWLLAVVASTAVCLLWLAYLNRDGCWLYWRGYSAVAFFALPWLWIALLFGLKWKGRVALLLISVVGAPLVPHVDIWYVSATQARAVNTLRNLHGKADEAAKRNAYPETWPEPNPVQRFYSFQYIAGRTSSGAVSYLLTATPLPRARACGCSRSFAMSEDGRIHHTTENRDATLNDAVLE